MAYIPPCTILRLIKKCPLDKDYNHTLLFKDRIVNNQVVKTGLEVQSDYFDKLPGQTFTDLTFQRPSNNTIRLNWHNPVGNETVNYSDILEYNYLYFTNGYSSTTGGATTNHGYGNKRFYAFINEIKYINDATVEIVYTIDVMQTWYFNYELGQCFIDREHSLTDGIGDNLIPEPLSVGDHIVNANGSTEKNFSIKSSTDSTKYHFLVSYIYIPKTENVEEVSTSRYRVKTKYVSSLGQWNMNGNGELYIGYTEDYVPSNLITNGNIPVGYKCITLDFEETANMTFSGVFSHIHNIIIHTLEGGSGDEYGLVGVICVPQGIIDTSSWVSAQRITVYHNGQDIGYIPYNLAFPKEYNYDGSFVMADEFKQEITEETGIISYAKTYTPRNNKLYTSPYNYVKVTNKTGQSIKLNWEYSNKKQFSSNKKIIDYKICGLALPNIELTFIPCYYNNHSLYSDSSLVLSNMPTGTWNKDSYATWLAENKNAWNMQVITKAIASIGAVIAAGAVGVVTGGVGAIAGIAAGGIGGFTSLMSLAAEQIQAQDKADTIEGGLTNAPIMWVLDNIGFNIENVIIPPDNAEMIDNYFSMFGYATKKVKVPNVRDTSILNANRERPYWNYVKTTGCVIHQPNNDNIAGLPAGEEEKIAQIYDKGITFWTPTYYQTTDTYTVDIGNYNQTNAARG